jgi:hypothetical protein
MFIANPKMEPLQRHAAPRVPFSNSRAAGQFKRDVDGCVRECQAQTGVLKRVVAAKIGEVCAPLMDHSAFFQLRRLS